jgi:predicted transcriptional regulator
MESTLEFFSNDRYSILKLLSENQVKIKEACYVTLSQQEIADMAHFSKLKTNKLLNELIQDGYVGLFNGKRGKYMLTEKGQKALHIIQKKP